MAGRTPERTGAAPDGSVPADPAVDRLLRTDGPVPPSAPVVGGGRLIVAIPSRVVALDPADGTVAWEREPATGVRPSPAPAVGCGVVVAATGDGLAAFALEDGSRRWRRAGGSDDAGPLAVADGVVYHPRGQETVAVDAATGDRLWAGGPGGAVAVDPAAGRVYATDDAVSEGTVTARSTDGEALWSTTGPGHLRTPAVAGDRVYALGEGALLALDADDGTVAWRRDGPEGFGAGVAVADGRVSAAAGGGTRAVGRDTGGQRVWRVPTGASGAAPVVAGGTVLLPGAEGLVAVDARTGTHRWTVEALEGQPSRTVAVVDGIVYASGFDGVYALR
jgi:outer membrane protein assembly factor BamB